MNHGERGGHGSQATASTCSIGPPGDPQVDHYMRGNEQWDDEDGQQGEREVDDGAHGFGLRQSVPILRRRVSMRHVALPRWPADLPARSAHFPRRPTDFPRRSTRLPRQPVDFPRRSVHLPRQPTDLPRRSVHLSRQPADLPRRSAYLPKLPADLPMVSGES